MTTFSQVEGCLELLNRIQAALSEKNFTVLLPMVEAYSESIRQITHIDSTSVIKQLLAAQEDVETSLHQLQRDVSGQIERVTQDKINHAYHAL